MMPNLCFGGYFFIVHLCYTFQHQWRSQDMGPSLIFSFRDCKKEGVYGRTRSSTFALAIRPEFFY